MSGYSTDDDNRLASDGTYDYEYDAEGNRTQRTTIATGQSVEYTWDYHNRLTGITFKDAGHAVTGSVLYTYDALDRRIGKQVDADGDSTYETVERREIHDLGPFGAKTGRREGPAPNHRGFHLIRFYVLRLACYNFASLIFV